jgi:N-acetyltransferase
MASDADRELVQPVTLRGSIALLEPLAEEHTPALAEAVKDGEMWRLWFTGVAPPEGMAEYVAKALLMRREEGGMPFVVRLAATGEVMGCTRYCRVDGVNRRVEIGYTWYAKRAQRTALNTECKLLLLAHAFEALGCIAVEFRTHWFNHASRTAIERLGAKQDGVLRNHLVWPPGVKRDTVVYSIIDGEWPAVKQHLSFQLTRPRS